MIITEHDGDEGWGPAAVGAAGEEVAEHERQPARVVAREAAVLDVELALVVAAQLPHLPRARCNAHGWCQSLIGLRVQSYLGAHVGWVVLG
jgi:hypothetical protein